MEIRDKVPLKYHWKGNASGLPEDHRHGGASACLYPERLSQEWAGRLVLGIDSYRTTEPDNRGDSWQHGRNDGGVAAMGKKGGLPARLTPEDEESFPGLVSAGYRVSSPKDPNHNCMAYAAGDTSRKWDPARIPVPGYYWPP